MSAATPSFHAEMNLEALGTPIPYQAALRDQIVRVGENVSAQGQVSANACPTRSHAGGEASVLRAPRPSATASRAVQATGHATAVTPPRPRPRSRARASVGGTDLLAARGGAAARAGSGAERTTAASLTRPSRAGAHGAELRPAFRLRRMRAAPAAASPHSRPGAPSGRGQGAERAGGGHREDAGADPAEPGARQE